jgi:hypothetical protein
VEVFAAIVIVAVPEPVPEAGLTLAQAAPLEAVQPQPASAVAATLDVPAPAATDSVVGAAVNVQPGAKSMVNWFESALRPVPLGPTAATRDS